jgi:hypothetical protein
MTVPSALASTAPVAGSYNCTVRVTEPTMHAHVIYGLATSQCTGTGWQDQRLKVSIEEFVFPTLIEVKATAITDFSASSTLSQWVTFNCAGTGTHYYSVEASWTGADGNAHDYRYPPKEERLSC